MTLLAKKRNGSSLPGLVDNFFNMDRFFSPSVFNFDGDLLDLDRALVVPSANITESEKEYTIEMAVPGMTKKDFDIEVKDGVLTISAEKEEEMKEDKKNYHRREFSYHSFNRSFALPDNLNSEKIDAKYENGILRLSLPKKMVSAAKPAQHIKVG